MMLNLTNDPGCLGHHYIVGLTGPELTDQDKQILSTLRPAGILLDAHNFAATLPYQEWLPRLAALLTGVRQYTERDSLMISLDNEGGTFSRAPAPITRFPFPLHFRHAVSDVAAVMCHEAKSLGVNTLWAPLADVNWNPDNPIIGERAFGTTVAEVIEPIVQTVTTYHEHGILSCAKHYPGHGGTSVDSHHELPYLDISLEELRKRDLAPFAAAIDAGVPLIMTAHIQYPRIDGRCPATLSTRIMRDLLRQELKFKGVVVADRLEMAAVAKLFRGVEPLIMALKASVDTFMIGQHYEHALFLARETLAALHRGDIEESLLHESFERISRLHAGMKSYEPTLLSPETLARHAAMASRFL